MTLLVREEGSERVDAFPLVPVGTIGERIEVAQGAVKEDGCYRFAIVTGDEYIPKSSKLVINGDEDFGPCPVIPRERLNRKGLPPTWSEDREAFSLIYGFARAEVELVGLDGRKLLSTRDIPVLVRGDSDEDEARLARMYETLFSSERDKALQLMLSGFARESERFSIIEGSTVERSPRSLSTFIQMSEEVLDGLESVLPQLRVRPMQRISTIKTRADGGRVYRLDRDEVLWIATHPDVLERTAATTGIGDGWSHYMPRYVETRRHVRSLDTYENQAILSFIAHCAGVTGHLGDLLASYSVDDTRVIRALNRHWDDGYVASPLTVLRVSGSGRERARAALARLTERGLRLSRYYAQAFSGALAHEYRLPRRTKVFQEVPTYMRVYELMERWESFGDVDLTGNGLALFTPRIDTFYEYYCLYLLLDALIGLGFEAVRTDFVKYTYENPFHSSSGIANRYEMARGSKRVLLFYEPVAYGYRNAEHGVGLQRVTATPGQSKPVYTPDFLLRLDCGDGVFRDFVLDAKYSRVSDVAEKVRGFCLDGRSVTATTLTECILKYQVGCVSSETGRPPAAVWLLCGKGDGDVVEFCVQSPWASERADVHTSGALALGWSSEGLGSLLTSFGLANSPDGRTAITSESQSHEEKIRPDRRAPHGRSSRHSSEYRQSKRRESKPFQGQESHSDLGNVVGPSKEEASLVYEALSDRYDLFGTQWSSREIGLREPFYRRSLGDGSTSDDYQLMFVRGEMLFFRNRLDQKQLRKFRMLVQRLEPRIVY